MAQQSSGQGMAIAALVLGIVAITTSLIWFISVPTGVLAIVFGALGLKSAGRRKALAGVITGSLGVIFSILFIVLAIIALPALQRAQRDTVRRSDVSTVMTQITVYQADNRGALPSAADITTHNLTSLASIASEGDPATDIAVYRVGFNCDNEEVSARSYSVRIMLEDDTVYCIDS